MRDAFPLYLREEAALPSPMTTQAHPRLPVSHAATGLIPTWQRKRPDEGPWSEAPPLTRLGGPISRELEREDFDLPVRAGG
jgi:hypothetical protein